MMQRTVSIAPMMKCTDRHGRYLLRLISPHVDLYTEMLTAQAVIHGDPQHLLAFDAIEHPIALQLGGSDPKQLAEATQIACAWGYDEINLNVGCPSHKVHSGQFGACLFKQPELVAECLSAMRSVAQCPVTVKTRIGVDDQDRYTDLVRFVEVVQQAGCEVLIIHARKAWLKGLNPKENRTKPPLDYERVIRLKQDFPHLTFIMNGGIETLEAIQAHLAVVDGVMIGRAAYHNPFMLLEVERAIFNQPNTASYQTVISHYLPYMEERLAEGAPIGKLIKPVLGLFRGLEGGRSRRGLLTSGCKVFEQVRDCLQGYSPSIYSEASTE